MPTLLIKQGYRFFFFLAEPEFKKPHIHVEKDDGSAIFWLEPQVSLQKTRGLTGKELNVARKIVLEYQKEFLEKYYELISPNYK
jgi:hypothetical protein